MSQHCVPLLQTVPLKVQVVRDQKRPAHGCGTQTASFWPAVSCQPLPSAGSEAQVAVAV